VCGLSISCMRGSDRICGHGTPHSLTRLATLSNRNTIIPRRASLGPLGLWVLVCSGLTWTDRISPSRSCARGSVSPVPLSGPSIRDQESLLRNTNERCPTPESSEFEQYPVVLSSWWPWGHLEHSPLTGVVTEREEGSCTHQELPNILFPPFSARR
jgi:hypothetical protein